MSATQWGVALCLGGGQPGAVAGMRDGEAATPPSDLTARDLQQLPVGRHHTSLANPSGPVQLGGALGKRRRGTRRARCHSRAGRRVRGQ